MKKQNIAGLYIEDGKISVSRLKSGSASKVAKVVDVPIPEGTVEKGRILEADILAKLIKNAFSKNRIRTKNVAVTVSNLPLITHLSVLPKVPEDKIKEALKPEMSKYMTGEEALIDFYPLEKNKALLFAIKKSFADSLLSVIRKTGLNLVAIDIGLFAALRTLINNNVDPASEDTTMLGLISYNKIELAIIRKGIPQYIHSASASGISDMAREVELTQKSWQEESPEHPVKKIIILGGDTENLRSQLEEKDLELAKPLGDSADKYSFPQVISLGLALRGPQSYDFDINFLPPEKYREALMKKRFFSVFISWAVIITLFLGVSFMLSNMISSFQRKLVPVEQELSGYQNLLTEMERVLITKESLSGDISPKEEFISQLDRLPLVQILEDIRKFIPKEVWLTKISNRTKGSIVLTGKSLSQEAIYRYVNLLYFSEHFDEPKVASMITEEEKGFQVIDFSIVCPLSKEERDED